MMKVCSATLLLLLSAFPALAQLRYSNPRITVFGAGSFQGGQRLFVVNSSGTTETDYASGVRGGFRFGVDLPDRLGAEATYAFSSNDLKVRDPVPPGPGGPRRNFTIHQHQFMVNGFYNFTPRDNEWRPFVTVGLGLVRFSPTKDAVNRAAVNFLDGPTRISPNTKLAMNFGAGVEKTVSDRVGVRFDMRDNIAGMPTYGLPQSPLNPGGAFYPVKGVIHDLEIGFGLVFHLD